MLKESTYFYLASSSPRRYDLLQQLGLPFKVLSQSAEEIRMADELPEDYVARLSQIKANSGLAMLAPEDYRPVIGADTIVLWQGQILEKPDNKSHGREMLELLSGKCHQVITGVTIVNKQKSKTILSRTLVQFKDISCNEIDNYWQSGEPLGKAGGYAIQGLGALFVSKIEGSYSGVVGLPLYETSILLEHFNIDASCIMSNRLTNE